MNPVDAEAATSGRQLFIYWRCETAAATAAVAAARRMQQDLCQRHPALLARLFRRCDGHDAAASCTLMETYAVPAPGVGAELQAELLAAGSELLPWLAGPRHVEVFEPLA